MHDGTEHNIRYVPQGVCLEGTRGTATLGRSYSRWVRGSSENIVEAIPVRATCNDGNSKRAGVRGREGRWLCRTQLCENKESYVTSIMIAVLLFCVAPQMIVGQRYVWIYQGYVLKVAVYLQAMVIVLMVLCPCNGCICAYT